MQHDKLHTTDDDENDILKDGEWRIINPMVKGRVVKDHRPGTAMTFRDTNLNDARRLMEDAYSRSVESLNAWRNEGATTTHGPVTDANRADAYERSAYDLNSWRYDQ